jgi:hypothetical protein
MACPDGALWRFSCRCSGSSSSRNQNPWYRESGLRPATIARRCAAVRHFYRLSGIDQLPTDAAVIKTTMKGLRRSLGTAQAKILSDRFERPCSEIKAVSALPLAAMQIRHIAKLGIERCLLRCVRQASAS